MPYIPICGTCMYYDFETQTCSFCYDESGSLSVDPADDACGNFWADDACGNFWAYD